MRLLHMGLGLALLAVAVPAIACDCLMPAAERWAGCAAQALPRGALAEVDRLWTRRNASYARGSVVRPDRRAERRWFARWRGPLVARCGRLKAAQARDVQEKRVGIPPPFDEIDAIAFRNPRR